MIEDLLIKNPEQGILTKVYPLRTPMPRFNSAAVMPSEAPSTVFTVKVKIGNLKSKQVPAGAF